MTIPFTPIATQTIAVTGTASSITVPDEHAQVRFYNVGPGVCYIKFSTSTSLNGVVNATVNDMPLPVGYVETFTIGIQDTISAISDTTSTLKVTTGFGA